MIHSNSVKNHKIENWTYANAAARTGATGFLNADIGKLAYQTDNQTYWRLTAVTPTWIQAMAGPAGAAGAPGAVWRSGAGAPDNGVGIDGDFYLRTSNGDVYQRAAGVYAVIDNLTGPAGAAGAPGDDGEGVPTGGTAGQVLTKDSGTDFDTSWQDAGGGSIIQRKLAPGDLTSGGFDFVGIPQTYRHLRMTFIGRVQDTGGVDMTPLIAKLKFNNSFGASAMKRKQVDDDAPVYSVVPNADDTVEVGEVQSMSANPGWAAIGASQIIIEIDEYAFASANKSMTVRSMWKDADNLVRCRLDYAVPGIATSAINRLTLTIAGMLAGALSANSVCTIELSGKI